MSQLLFFPWYETRDVRSVAGFELLPFRPGQSPLADERQAHIDLIMSCYKDGAGTEVCRGTVLRVGSHDVLDDLQDFEHEAASEFARYRSRGAPGGSHHLHPGPGQALDSVPGAA